LNDSLKYIDAETEKIILATLLHGGATPPDLTVDDFGVESHRQIWRSIERIAPEVELGADSVTHDLIARGKLESVGGMSMLMDLHALVERGMPLAGFTRILKEKSAVRRIARRAQQIDGDLALHGLNGNGPQIIEAAREIAALAGGVHAGPFHVADIRSVGEYANIKIDYLFPGMLAVGTVNLLSGDAGCGKSTYASFIADRVAAQRPVLYVDRENPLPVVAERFERLGIRDGGNLKVWGGWCAVEPPGPDSTELLGWVKSCDPKPLLIWDSLISFHTGEENDAGETRRYMQGYRHLADLGACIMVLHHSGKGETTKDYRGSSDIKASIDTGWHLANFGEGRLERLRLRAWKCRFAVASDVLLTYRDGQFVAEAASSMRTVTELLADLLKANPGVKAADFETLARDKGLGRDRARQFLDEGVAAGRIRRDRGDHNTRNHTWIGSEDSTL